MHTPVAAVPGGKCADMEPLFRLCPEADIPIARINVRTDRCNAELSRARVLVPV
jgi:hypothetical protein